MNRPTIAGVVFLSLLGSAMAQVASPYVSWWEEQTSGGTWERHGNFGGASATAAQQNCVADIASNMMQNPVPVSFGCQNTATASPTWWFETYDSINRLYIQHGPFADQTSCSNYQGSIAIAEAAFQQFPRTCEQD